MSKPCDTINLGDKLRSGCPSQRHRSKDLDFETLRLVKDGLSLPIHLFIGLASSGRWNLVNFSDTGSIADIPEGRIFESNFLPLNVVG